MSIISSLQWIHYCRTFRSPFEGSDEYTKTRNDLVTQSISLAKAVSPREDLNIKQAQEIMTKTVSTKYINKPLNLLYNSERRDISHDKDKTLERNWWTDPKV